MRMNGYPWESNSYSQDEYVIEQKSKGSSSGWSNCGSTNDEDTAFILMEDKAVRENDKVFRIKCGNRTIGYSS